MCTEPKLMLQKNKHTVTTKSDTNKAVFRLEFGKLVQFLEEIQVIFRQQLGIRNFNKVF